MCWLRLWDNQLNTIIILYIKTLDPHLTMALDTYSMMWFIMDWGTETVTMLHTSGFDNTLVILCCLSQTMICLSRFSQNRQPALRSNPILPVDHQLSDRQASCNSLWNWENWHPGPSRSALALLRVSSSPHCSSSCVFGLIQKGDKSAYRLEVEQLAVWCSHNNLELNMLITVEMIVDCPHSPSLAALWLQWSHSGF